MERQVHHLALAAMEWRLQLVGLLLHMLVAAVAVKALTAHQVMVALEERVEAVQALIVQPQHPELLT
jgi:hypothetical protein